jgi:hypothetical protein
MVAGFDAGDAFAHFLDDARALVAEHGREQPLRVLPGQGVGVGVADAGGDNLHQHFTGFRAGHVDFFNNQGFACFPGDGGSRFHALLRNR